MNKTKPLLALLAIPLGVFFFVYGGYDDSPGAQLLGFLVVATGIAVLLKSRKRGSR